MVHKIVDPDDQLMMTDGWSPEVHVDEKCSAHVQVGSGELCNCSECRMVRAEGQSLECDICEFEGQKPVGSHCTKCNTFGPKRKQVKAPEPSEGGFDCGSCQVM